MKNVYSILNFSAITFIYMFRNDCGPSVFNYVYVSDTHSTVEIIDNKHNHTVGEVDFGFSIY
jgi:hypothetical protein